MGERGRETDLWKDSSTHARTARQNDKRTEGGAIPGKAWRCADSDSLSIIYDVEVVPAPHGDAERPGFAEEEACKRVTSMRLVWNAVGNKYVQQLSQVMIRIVVDVVVVVDVVAVLSVAGAAAVVAAAATATASRPTQTPNKVQTALPHIVLNLFQLPVGFTTPSNLYALHRHV